MRIALAFGLLLVLGFAGPAHASEAQQATRITIETEGDARHGEQHPTTVVLTDSRGNPLSGETIVLLEEIGLFDYQGVAVVAESQTDYRGAASFVHVPLAPGNGRLIAEYGGNASFAPATAAVPFSVGEGIGLFTPVIPEPSAPLLPRGVTAAWFLPLLVGVWLALGAAVYHLVRIPREVQAPRGVV